MDLSRIAAAVCGVTVLSGCAEMTHLTRTRDAGDVEYILIDAKQRAITARGGISCAEPSPDALSALAASQGLSLSTPEGTNLAQSLALAETAGSIGLRTQSIQLMRDHMYRVCEAYQAGQITGNTASLLHRRFQSTVVAILAIEQLTGTVRAPTIVLGSSADVGNAEAIVKLSESRTRQAANVDAAVKDLDAKKTGTAQAQGEVDAARAALNEATDENRASLQTTLNAKTQNLADAKAAELTADGNLATQRAALAAIDRAMTLASSTGSASGAGTVESVSHTNPADISAIATAVERIVVRTFDQTNSGDLCALILANAAERSDADGSNPVLSECLKMLRSGTPFIYSQ